LPDPTKEVTPGVLRTTYQLSSLIAISTSTYPGKTLRFTVWRWPLRISISSSIGTSTWKIWSSTPIDSMRCSRLAFTLFSYPE
jgi:hypothetical protein